MNGRFAAFLPSVEVDLGQEIFLPADPWTLLKSGKIADVPVMAGITADESSFFVQSNHRYDIHIYVNVVWTTLKCLSFSVMLGNIDEMNEHFENFLPNDLNITDTKQKIQLGEELKSFYFDDKSISTDTTKEFMMVST